MSWSLKLRNGDLALSGSSLETVSGAPKLVQDLRCWILERMGTDNLHPGFGSLFDGGVEPNGTVHTSVIGTFNEEIARLDIESDLRRILNEYQAKQVARLKVDRATYGKSTFSRGEVLVAVEGIEFTVALDTIYIVISLRTGDDSILSLDLTLQG